MKWKNKYKEKEKKNVDNQLKIESGMLKMFTFMDFVIFVFCVQSICQLICSNEFFSKSFPSFWFKCVKWYQYVAYFKDIDK